MRPERRRLPYDPNWVSTDEVGLVAVGIAADPAAAHEDYFSENKTQMLESLQESGVYPR